MGVLPQSPVDRQTGAIPCYWVFCLVVIKL